ncbi:hypothetical protein Nepgr_017425 [Nepenthes gracilis]|uniref:Uncharacterized protein n=1 Tax=Nepenthes gracilis TaxID=150966 RepID=A0AAD3XT29_NEPGR|nr:hypothetical protein Nepgr_017425 [Nepenthes gracilis]
MFQQNCCSALKPNGCLLECSPQQCCSVLEAVGLKPEQHSSSMALDDNGFLFISSDVKGEASALWDPALVGMDCGRVDQSVTVANNLRGLKVLAPLPVLSGRIKGPEVDSSLMRSECSVEGHFLTVPELGAGPLSADTSSAHGCSNVDEELLNVVVCVSGDRCVDLEEQIDSESKQQFAVPLPVAGVSDESGEPGITFLMNSGNVHECTFLLGAVGALGKSSSAEEGAARFVAEAICCHMMWPLYATDYVI